MKKIIVLGSILICLLASCTREKQVQEPLIARVGDSILTQKMLNQVTPSELSGEQRIYFQKHFVNEWINNQVLLSYIHKNRLDLTAKDKYLISDYRMQLLLNHLYTFILSEQIDISDKDILEYYNQHKNEYIRTEDEVHLVILYLEQPNIGIQDDIKHSKSLLEVIEKNFLNTNPGNQMEMNGDIGYVPVHSLKKSFQREIKRMRPGSISRPIRDKKSIYYFQLLDYKKKNTIRSLELVKDIIIHELRQQKLNEAKLKIIREESQYLDIDKFFEKIN